MKTEKLVDLKKELSHKTVQDLVAVCLRLAKYKKENKELLAYLLYNAHDALAYAEKVKTAFQSDFEALNKHYYYSTKSLRKILRSLNKHAKYTQSKQVEVELLIWFCKNYLIYVDKSTSYKPLQALVIRQLDKIDKLVAALEDDLQYDYTIEVKNLLQGGIRQLKWFTQQDIAVRFRIRPD